MKKMVVWLGKFWNWFFFMFIKIPLLTTTAVLKFMVLAMPFILITGVIGWLFNDHSYGFFTDIFIIALMIGFYGYTNFGKRLIEKWIEWATKGWQ